MRTQEDLVNHIQFRSLAFQTAEALVKPTVEQHGLVNVDGPTTIFAKGYTSTPVEQHLNETLRVADWLLEEVE